MTLNIDRFKRDIEALIDRGMLLEIAMIRDTLGKDAVKEYLKSLGEEAAAAILKKAPIFKTEYEKWYSECLPLIRQLLPDRLDAFVRQYEKPKSRKEIAADNYVIEDYMLGIQVTYAGKVKVDGKSAFPKLKNQTAILGAALSRFESSLFEIRQLVQADLFDSEIKSARHLFDNKFLRAAGAIAGVVLEKHLRQVCIDHNIPIVKKNPTIGDLNEAIKVGGVIDIPQWRHITLLGDIRNICDHNKQREPTEQQVSDLIDGTDRVMKTIS